jgi:NTE family protein
MRSTALVLPGGGARAAYQVGFLRHVARAFPDVRFDVIVGVSAGAINAAFLASHRGPFTEAVEELADVWRGLTTRDVFRVDTRSLVRSLAGWSARLATGGTWASPTTRGLVDTSPLVELLTRRLGARPDGTLPGVDGNLIDGRLRALALTASSYGTARTVTWVQGADLAGWSRPGRRGTPTALTVAHVTASSALPLLFPAVRLTDGWYGDGGIRLAAPLSPAIRLGADRILAVTTSRPDSVRHESDADAARYPPPAQVAGVLLNSVFLDLVDQDAGRIEQTNRLLTHVPRSERRGLRHVDVLVQRPAASLGSLASRHEFELPWLVRWLTRGWGTREVASNDALSLLLFEHGYIELLMGIGESDAVARHAELERFFRTRQVGAPISLARGSVRRRTS